MECELAGDEYHQVPSGLCVDCVVVAFEFLKLFI